MKMEANNQFEFHITYITEYRCHQRGHIKTCTNLATVSGHKNQIPERDNCEYT